MGTATVSTLKRSGRRDTPAGVWVHAEAQVADAPVGAHAGAVGTATVPTQNGAGHGRQGNAVAAGIDAEALSARADSGRDTFAVRATSGTVGDAVVRGIRGETWNAAAHPWGDALAVGATSGTLWDALAIRVEGEA